MTSIQELLATEPEALYSPKPMRRMRYRWNLTEPVLNDRGELVTEVLTLTAAHNADRKYFYASLSYSTLRKSDRFGGSIIESFNLHDSSFSLRTESVPRYSAIGLQHFATRALAEARTEAIAERMETIVQRQRQDEEMAND